MLAISLVGVTPGLELATFGKLPVQLVDDWVSISTSEILLPRGKNLYVISRRIENGHILTWIAYFRHALELGGSRGGGFYGAGLWLLDKTAPGDGITNLLPQLADQVNQLAMSNGQFIKRITDIRELVQWPDAEGKRVNQSMQDIVAGVGLGNGDLPHGYLDLSSPNDAPYLGWFLDWVQSGVAFNGFSRIIISTDPEVTASAESLKRLVVVTPETLLKQESEQGDTSSKRLTLINAKLADAERQIISQQSENVALRQSLQQAQREQADLRGKFGQCQKDSADTADRLKQPTPPGRLNSGYPVSEQRPIPTDFPAVARPISEISTFEWQAQARDLASENQSLRARIREMGDEINNLRSTKEQEFQNMKNTQSLDGGHLFLWIIGGSALILCALLFVKWPSSETQPKITKIDHHEQIALPNQDCSSAYNDEPATAVNIQVRQATSVRDAVEIIYRNACSRRPIECKDNDQRTIRDTLLAAEPVSNSTGVPTFNRGSNFELRLPGGCIASVDEAAAILVSSSGVKKKVDDAAPITEEKLSSRSTLPNTSTFSSNLKANRGRTFP